MDGWMDGSPTSLATSEPTETPAPSPPGNPSWLLPPHTSFSPKLLQILLGWVGIPKGQQSLDPPSVPPAPDRGQVRMEGGPVMIISALLCDLGRLLVVSSLAVLIMEGGAWR